MLILPEEEMAKEEDNRVEELLELLAAGLLFRSDLLINIMELIQRKKLVISACC